MRSFSAVRATDNPIASDRFGPFSKAHAYEGWSRSIYPVVWFDSEPERNVANMVDGDDGVAWWLRLHVGDLPIVWNFEGREYNPDLVVIDADGMHWLVEVKMDKEMTSDEVLAKRKAALKWVRNVNAAPQVDATWRYLLASETDVRTAKGSWAALRRLGSA